MVMYSQLSAASGRELESIVRVLHKRCSGLTWEPACRSVNVQAGRRGVYVLPRGFTYDSRPREIEVLDDTFGPIPRQFESSHSVDSSGNGSSR